MLSQFPQAAVRLNGNRPTEASTLVPVPALFGAAAALQHGVPKPTFFGLHCQGWPRDWIIRVVVSSWGKWGKLGFSIWGRRWSNLLDMRVRFSRALRLPTVSKHVAPQLSPVRAFVFCGRVSKASTLFMLRAL